MSYATADEMLRAVGVERLKRLVPDLQADSLVTRLDEALAIGAAKIESRIGHVYATPLGLADISDASQKASAQAQLRRVNIFLALEALTIGLDKLPASITQGISAADAWIATLAKREGRIPGLTASSRPIIRAFSNGEDAGNTLDSALFEGFASL